MKFKNFSAILITIIFSVLLLSNCKKDNDVLPPVVAPLNPIEAARDSAAPANLQGTIGDSIAPASPEETTGDSTSVINPIETIHDLKAVLGDTMQATQDSLDRLAVAASNVGSDYHNIESSLPAGHVKDGSVDYTSYIQTALNKYSKIAFPGFPIMVNDNGLFIPSNRTICFINGSKLILKPTSKSTYNIIRLNNVSNVTLVDPYIVGDRYNHKGTSGEWGNGIGIYGSTNINISKARIEECWGDGIYIGKSATRTNKNIRIFKPYVKSNRRDGISIIDADGLKIISAYAGFSDGTAPYSGINIEPNDPGSELKNIEITNAVTEGNKGKGIQAGFGNLYGGTNKTVGVTIINHKDIGSGMALLASCRTTKRVGRETISGTFTIAGTNWQKNTNKPLDIYSPDPNLKFIISKPRVMTLAGIYLTDAETQTLLTGKKSIWSPTVYTMNF